MMVWRQEDHSCGETGCFGRIFAFVMCFSRFPLGSVVALLRYGHQPEKAKLGLLHLEITLHVVILPYQDTEATMQYKPREI